MQILNSENVLLFYGSMILKLAKNDGILIFRTVISLYYS